MSSQLMRARSWEECLDCWSLLSRRQRREATEPVSVTLPCNVKIRKIKNQRNINTFKSPLEKFNLLMFKLLIGAVVIPHFKDKKIFSYKFSSNWHFDFDNDLTGTCVFVWVKSFIKIMDWTCSQSDCLQQLVCSW